MNIAFYTVSDANYLKGALPLLRSVKRFYPEASLHIISLRGDIEVSHHSLEMLGIHLHELIPTPILPTSLESKRHFMTKYYCLPIEAEYLVYIDADAFLSGRIDELLNVPDGKVGFVNEEYLGYTIRDQFNDTLFIESHRDYESIANMPSFNSGVFCGRKKDLLKLLYLIEDTYHDDHLTINTRTDQGLLAWCLTKSNISIVLPNRCNMIDEYWNGQTHSVIHFAGWPRPWVWSKARPDNSFPAFKTWRQFSRISDFIKPNEFIAELFWRSLDNIRPFVRATKNKIGFVIK